MTSHMDCTGVCTHRGPRPLEAEAAGDDPLVAGEGEQQEPGRALPPRHAQRDPCTPADQSEAGITVT